MIALVAETKEQFSFASGLLAKEDLMLESGCEIPQ